MNLINFYLAWRFKPGIAFCHKGAKSLSNTKIIFVNLWALVF
jgi:hypothetical protein